MAIESEFQPHRGQIEQQIKDPLILEYRFYLKEVEDILLRTLKPLVTSRDGYLVDNSGYSDLEEVKSPSTPSMPLGGNLSRVNASTVDLIDKIIDEIKGSDPVIALTTAVRVLSRQGGSDGDIGILQRELLRVQGSSARHN